MTLALAYWVIMLVWLVFGLLIHFAVIGGMLIVGASTVLLFILFLLLGWQVFGPPLHR
jgi:hypothetical protein